MTASRRVYLSLRERIVEMELLPGTRIVEKALAEEFGTSRTPVHEAVQRLAEGAHRCPGARRYVRLAHPAQYARRSHARA